METKIVNILFRERKNHYGDLTKSIATAGVLAGEQGYVSVDRNPCSAKPNAPDGRKK